jgi:glycerophosphoryl diester phosphodiesterase
MNTIKINKGDTRLIAHRGLSGIECENTNSAFVAAGNRTYFGIETDIYRTSDGKFAVNHDGNLKRISGDDIAVEGVSLDTLQSVVLFDKLGGKLRRDIRVSSLEEYLFICKKYEKHAVLELKSDFTDEEIEKIIEIIRSFDYLDHLTFISFKYSNLEKVRQILPTQSAQFLFSTWSEETFEKLLKAKIDIDSNHNAITEEIIKRAHEAGLTVNVWTVDEISVAENLVDNGIDYITTNIIE